MTFLQIHLAVSLIIEDKMRENGLDPDEPPTAPETLSGPAELAAFFGG